MADIAPIETDNYVSSKQASEATGYAQDHIGYLARRELIDARRVGGLWCVSLPSLLSYKSRADSYTPAVPVRSAGSQDTNALISLDGSDYVSAARAAEITGYHQDYVGQLARTGKILSRHIGNRWFVERAGILNHKREKDALLGAVQAQSVGLPNRSGGMKSENTMSPDGDASTYFTYTRDDADLLPLTAQRADEAANLSSAGHEFSRIVQVGDSSAVLIPIRVVNRTHDVAARNYSPAPSIRSDLPSATSGGTGFLRIFATAAATIVIVIAIGYVSLRNSEIYAKMDPISGDSNLALLDPASNAFAPVLDFVEEWIAPELIYRRRK